MPINQLTPIELQKKIQGQEPIFLLDVREPFEYNLCRIEGSLSMPLNEVPQRLREIDFDKEVVVICHHGMRSQQAANFLGHVGFKKISNLAGGIDQWSLDCDSTVPRY